MMLASQERISAWNKAAFAVALLLPSTAFAQQQTPSVAETALQINSVVSQWATTLTQQARTIEELQKKVKELEAKEKPDAGTKPIK